MTDLRQSSAHDLAATLEGMVETMKSEGLDVVLQISGEAPVLPADTLHQLRMVTQEALTNARKHSQGTHFLLSLTNSDAGLTLAVRDDGCGFNTQASAAGTPGHFGCVGIRERCQKIGASVRWQSAAGAGTEVTITLPTR